MNNNHSAGFILAIERDGDNKYRIQFLDALTRMLIKEFISDKIPDIQDLMNSNPLNNSTGSVLPPSTS